jgi:predicted nucleic acid-binding protein
MLKRKRITLAQAQHALKAYERISLRFIDVELSEALLLADQLSVYAYDAYLLRCALQMRCPLLTLDRGLIAAAKRVPVNTVEVSS